MVDGGGDVGDALGRRGVVWEFGSGCKVRGRKLGADKRDVWGNEEKGGEEGCEGGREGEAVGEVADEGGVCRCG